MAVPAVVPTACNALSDTVGRFTLTLGVVTVQVMGTTALLLALVVSVVDNPLLNAQLRQVAIGLPDEINNALMATYGLHQQRHPLLVTARVRRVVSLKVSAAALTRADTVRSSAGCATSWGASRARACGSPSRQRSRQPRLDSASPAFGGWTLSHLHRTGSTPMTGRR